MSEYIIAHCVDSVSGVRYDERREEIVRCLDCAHSIANGDGCGRCGDFIEVEPDGFCKWAERWEDEE